MQAIEQYPDYLLRERRRVNRGLIPLIQKNFTDRFVRAEVTRCLIPGRKIRSILFLRTLGALHPGFSRPNAAKVTLAIELSHAASVLVDDILDSDDIRHGAPATETVWGRRKATLFAHLLAGAAIDVMKWHPELQASLTTVYREMCFGEMFDIFLPPGRWIADGYNTRVSRKTSELFSFALGAAQTIAGPEFAALPLTQLGRCIGELYQLSNDYYDWQERNLNKRHTRGAKWPITFSFPLAVYLNHYGKRRISRFLRTNLLSYNQWKSFLSIIWTPLVAKQCEQRIRSCREELLGAIENCPIPAPLPSAYRAMVELITNEIFWYHTYDLT